jgi:hypothetical protein
LVLLNFHYSTGYMFRLLPSSDLYKICFHTVCIKRYNIKVLLFLFFWDKVLQYWNVFSFHFLNCNGLSQFSFSKRCDDYCSNKKQNIKVIKKFFTSFVAFCPIFLILSTIEMLRNSETKSLLYSQFQSYHSQFNDTEF